MKKRNEGAKKKTGLKLREQFFLLVGSIFLMGREGLVRVRESSVSDIPESWDTVEWEWIEDSPECVEESSDCVEPVPDNLSRVRATTLTLSRSSSDSVSELGNSTPPSFTYLKNVNKLIKT